MKDILRNLAMIDLNNLCKEHGIDITDSYVIKDGRGYKYSLFSRKQGKALASVVFSKSSVPVHYLWRY